jgi:heme-degrading monooxygenase HmoA
MYAAIRRYNVNEGAADRIVERVNAEFLPRLRQAPGFVSYFIIDGGDGTIASVTVFEDKRGADDSSRIASEWVRQNLSHLVKTAPVILSGEVRTHAMETAAR